MATANFHERIQRIQNAHSSGMAHAMASPVQGYIPDGGNSVIMRPGRKKVPLKFFLYPIVMGVFWGFVVGMMLTGVTTDGSPIGPGTPLNSAAFLAGLFGLGMAPVFMFSALLLQGKRPRFAFFALAYLSGLILTLLI